MRKNKLWCCAEENFRRKSPRVTANIQSFDVEHSGDASVVWGLDSHVFSRGWFLYKIIRLFVLQKCMWISFVWRISKPKNFETSDAMASVSKNPTLRCPKALLQQIHKHSRSEFQNESTSKVEKTKRICHTTTVSTWHFLWRTFVLRTGWIRWLFLRSELLLFSVFFCSPRWQTVLASWGLSTPVQIFFGNCSKERFALRIVPPELFYRTDCTVQHSNVC